MEARIAWFSAHTAGKSFSKGAYATDTLLPLLKRHFEIDLYCEKAGCKLGGSESRNFLTANINDKQKPYDFFIYNFENKKFADFIRIHLGLMPGICWFHDFNLFDDGPEPILNSPWKRMAELFIDPSKPDFCWPTYKDLFIPSRPAAVRESGISFFNLFSNERDLAQYRSIDSLRINPEDKGSFIPLPVDSKYFDSESGASEVSVAVCSSPSVDSHIHNLLFALKNIKSAKLNWMLEDSEKEKAEELIREFGLTNVKFHTGKTAETWSGILKESRFAAHFLYSFYDQLQPWLAISMAHDKECLVLDFGEIEYLPDNAVYKINCGQMESLEISNVLTNKLQSSNIAKQYAAEKYVADEIAAQFEIYLKAIHSKYQHLKSNWHSLQKTAKNKLIQQGMPQIEEKNLEYFREIYSEIGWVL